MTARLPALAGLETAKGTIRFTPDRPRPAKKKAGGKTSAPRKRPGAS